MKEISGVTLGDLIDEELEERRKEDIQKARKIVSGILLNLTQWEHQKKQAEATIEKMAKKIAKANEKMTAIRAGNWSALVEEKPAGGNQQDADD